MTGQLADLAAETQRIAEAIVQARVACRAAWGEDGDIVVAWAEQLGRADAALGYETLCSAIGSWCQVVSRMALAGAKAPTSPEQLRQIGEAGWHLLPKRNTATLGSVIAALLGVGALARSAVGGVSTFARATKTGTREAARRRRQAARRGRR